MAKRFTETRKWDDPWFQDLSPTMKCVWSYITDHCDGAGVWNINVKLLSFQVGEAISWDSVLEKFGDRISNIGSGKIWIKKFIEFQYGRLSRDCKPHLPVFALLEKHGINLNGVSQSLGPGKNHNISPIKRDKIYRRDKFECAYCGKKKDAGLLVLDHVVPRRKGGSDQAKNLVAACAPCNSKKSDLSLSEFCLRYSLDSDTLSQRVSERVSQTLQEEEEDKEEDKEEEKDQDLNSEENDSIASVVPKKPRKRDLLWDSTCEAFDLKPATKTEGARIGRIVADLKAKSATPEEIPKRIARYRAEWPKAACTPEALLKHWDHFASERSTGLNGAATNLDTLNQNMADVLAAMGEVR